MPPVERELRTLPEHLSSHPDCSGVPVTRSLLLCVHFVCFVDRCFCSFILFLKTIVLSVLLRFMDSNYPFNIFKFFLQFLQMMKGWLKRHHSRNNSNLSMYQFFQRGAYEDTYNSAIFSQLCSFSLTANSNF